ncbi:GPN-loop GTPase 1 [Coemansia javaensis]|uniref:GPN-loop GTPase n=1 Tax=Coemansia javaensis TaxID=2761396 RepID=A0A9W8H7H8_9FUNG|nr:GPN-loop GTPase 1 [Coemansia javaensis]
MDASIAAEKPAAEKPPAAKAKAEAENPPTQTQRPEPVNLIMIGMAGSGKTTLMQRMNAYLHERNDAPYVVNLDPAVAKLPFQANIDIRDTVDYKQVMSEYSLGPNGGILTSLNLFATKLDQVMEIVEKRAQSKRYFLYDTPGQIEIFTWSASGTIITNTLAASHPTVVVYVVDTPRSASPATFMSNMMYACSILYKTQLPFLVAFNKTDVVDDAFAREWMADFEAFQRALAAEEDETFMNSLMHSMCLVLDEFYTHLRAVGVSAMTGQGIPDLFAKIDDAVAEYHAEFRPALERQAQQKRDAERAQKADQLRRLMKDLSTTDGKEVDLG